MAERYGGEEVEFCGEEELDCGEEGGCAEGED